MMIKSIRLVNWRSHADSFLEFRKGTNLLVGIMGAGKSSILEAISFALFGTFPALERRKVKLDNVFRLNESSVKIVLEFECDNHNYRIERTIERKKGTSSQAEIFRDNSLVENGPVAVNSYIQLLLGIDYDLFTRAIYSEQNNIEHFLNLDPKRRKEEVDTLLGLDKFELARTNVTAVINKFNSKKETLSSGINIEKTKELEEKEKIHSTALKASETDLITLKQSHQKLSEDYARLVASYSAMKAEKERFDLLEKETIRLSARYDSLSKDLNNQIDENTHNILHSKSLDLNSQRSACQVEMKSIEVNFSVLSKESGMIEAKIKSLSDSKARLQTMEENLKKERGSDTNESLSNLQTAKEQQLLSLESEKKSLEREIIEIVDIVSKLKSDVSECPLCSASITPSSLIHIKAEKDRLSAAKKVRVAEIISVVPALRKEIDGLKGRLIKISLLLAQIPSISSEILLSTPLIVKKESTEKALSLLKEQKSSIEKKLELLNKEIEKIQIESTLLKSLIEKKKELEDVTKNLSTTKSKLQSTNFNPVQFEEFRVSMEKLGLEKEKNLSLQKAAETKHSFSLDMLKMIQTELSSINLLSSQIAQLSLLIEQLAIYKLALLETQTSLRSTLIEAINGTMNEIWSIVYPYKNYHGLRLAVSERDYVFEVNDGGNWKALDSIASGGERASAALALRMALAMVLTPKLSWLILDEPTHNLDSQAVELLSHALQFRVPEVVKQVFVITHDEAFMGSDFASSYRINREKNNGGSSTVEVI